METKKTIVKDYINNVYSVIDFEKDKIPNNYVLEYPVYNSLQGKSYNIAKHEIDVFWTVGYYLCGVFFKKDKVEFFKINKPTIYVVCEYLNKFEKMSEEEFEKYFTEKKTKDF